MRPPRPAGARRSPVARQARGLETDFTAWADATATGDLDEFPWHRHVGGATLRARVAAENGFCGPGVCRAGGDCAFRRARREASTAEIVIVNHALLVAGRAAGGVLPPFRALIVDEAQHLESAITSQFTARVTYTRVARAVDLWTRGRRGAGGLVSELDPGLLAALAPPEKQALAEEGRHLTRLAPRVLEAAKRFFAQVALEESSASPYAPRRRFRSAEELYGDEPDGLEDLFVASREAEAASRRWRARRRGSIRPRITRSSRPTPRARSPSGAAVPLTWRASPTRADASPSTGGRVRSPSAPRSRPRPWPRPPRCASG